VNLDRRDFLKLTGIGGAVFASGLYGCASGTGQTAQDDFMFVQLSDTHWGFQGPPNPDAKVTLPKAIQAVNSMDMQPDFIVFTGDLTHTTDDPQERRRRLGEFKAIIGDLKVKNIRLIPGEHDASLDRGKAFTEFFGETHYTFDHKGVHFIALDNVSDPQAALGAEQLAWLADDLKKQDKNGRIVVLAHRPLFDLAPSWDWATSDGQKAIDLLTPFSHVTVFYGHIHQENHHMTGQIAHHAAKSLIFPLPAPGSQPKRVPVAWDPAQPYRGLGFRDIRADAAAHFPITELPVVKA
jgi:3',5'-cyclic AMP phosphodiesterase CpdA